MRVIIAGGTGFIGHALVNEFANRGDDVIVLSRKYKEVANATTVQWDAKTVGDWAKKLDGAGAVLNVVGESVFGVWTDERQKSIMDSRVNPTRALGEAIAKCKKPPEVWVNASAVGFYGSTYQPANEWSPSGDDYLAEVCRNWEAAQEQAQTPFTKKCQARIGFVLGKDGGAFPMLRKLTKFFLGSAEGSGKQYLAWIHVDDVAAAFRYAVDRKLEGPINVVGPSPLTNNEFMTRLRKKMHRPWAPNVPTFALAVGALFALPPLSVTLSSQNVVPERLKGLEFPFKFPTLDSVLDDLLKQQS